MPFHIYATRPRDPRTLPDRCSFATVNRQMLQPGRAEQLAGSFAR
jgi:hypothetical protein